jgi:hypothetical protein
MGGMAFPEAYTMQDQAQIQYIIKQLRWNKTVANDILVILDHIQLTSGFVAPILQSITKPIRYIDNSFLVSIHARLAERKGSLWIETAWTLSAQQEGNKSLMERFIQIPRIMTDILKKVNTVLTNYNNCRSSEPGRHHNLQWNDEWGLASRIKLAMAQDLVPTQIILGTILKMHPSNILHTILTIPTFPFQCQPRQAAWVWHPVPRNTWYPCSKTKSNLYLRQIDSTTVTKLLPSKMKGYYCSTGTVQEIPLDSHPITYQQVGENVWTQRPSNLSLSTSKENPPPGHLIYNTLTNLTME